jgi:hypothetical protein
MDQVFIQIEESMLEEKFGQVRLEYKAKGNCSASRRFIVEIISLFGL